MLCIQCGTENPENSKYCTKCNALILQAAPTGDPTSSQMEFEEQVDYPVPVAHYQSPVLQHLAWTVHEFMEEEGEYEPVVEAYEAFREIFEGFKVEIPKIQDLCYSQKGLLEDDPVPSQLKYIIMKAESLFTEGEELFEKYFDAVEALDEDDEDFPDPEPLVEGTKKWLGCNDSVCLAYDLLVNRTKDLDEFAGELEVAYKAKLAEEEAAGTSSVAETAPAMPTDSSELG